MAKGVPLIIFLLKDSGKVSSTNVFICTHMKMDYRCMKDCNSISIFTILKDFINLWNIRHQNHYTGTWPKSLVMNKSTDMNKRKKVAKKEKVLIRE